MNDPSGVPSTSKAEPGAVESRREMNVLEYVKRHAADVADLLAVVDNATLPAREVSQGPKTFVQRLPRHMRRRAMSYNVKRLPLKHRLAASQYASQSKHRKKPPSRKFRRHPSRLIPQRLLETHIWHARRFHMGDFCGLGPLPLRPTQRSGRPIYRDCMNHAIVQDISHQTCFQLSAKSRAPILAFLERFTPPQLGLTFAARSTLNDDCQLSGNAFQGGSFQQGASFQPATRFRQATTSGQETEVQEASIEQPTPLATSERLETSKDLATSTQPATSEHVPSFQHASSTVQLAMPENHARLTLLPPSPREGRTVVYNPGTYPLGVVGPVSFVWGPARIWIWTHGGMTEEFFALLKRELENEVDGGVKLEVFRHGFSRFRLRGPQALNVLQTSLKTVSTNDLHKFGSSAKWWGGGGSSFEVADWTDVGRDFIGILPLVIRDPRLTMKHAKRAERTEVWSQEIGEKSIKSSSKLLDAFRNSPLWSETTREKCVNEKKTQKALHNEHTRTLFDDPIIASKLPRQLMAPDESLLPIWAIFNVQPPFNSTSSTDFYIDLVVPRGWGLDVWLAVQYGTARAVGLENERALSLETGCLDAYQGLQGCPDSKTGRRIFNEEGDALKEKWARKPRNRRPDWKKLKIDHPFLLPFAELKNGHNFVLRDKVLMLKLAKNCATTEDLENLRKPIFEGALVPVRVISKGKGVPGRNGILYRKENAPELPKVEEKSKETDCERSQKSSDVESSEDDLLERMLFDGKDKKTKRKRKKKLPERLTKKTGGDFGLGNEENPVLLIGQNSDQSEAGLDLDSAQCPDAISGQISCQMQPLGYLVHGGFSFRLGKGVGLGFCYLPQLLNLLQTGDKRVLLRNITSKMYRDVDLYVIC